jgi:hypothetical protein
MELTIHTKLSFEVQTCITCGCQFAIPTELDRKLRENHKDFHCPNGHQQRYIGETEADKLRRELKRKEQELADEVQAKLNAQNLYFKTQKQLNRVSKGVCPCCNRSFKDLRRHMETKHPEVKRQPK